MTVMHDTDLDDLLALAARTRPAADPALLDRVLADALAAQPPGATVARAPASTTTAAFARPPGLLARLAQAFGGGPVLAGVTATLLLGMMVGYLSPDVADYLTGGSTGSAEMFPDSEFLTTEG
jgi:hypothetical protein